MFEYVRSHQRLMQFLLLLIIVPSFALVGLSSYIRTGASEIVLAKVAGQSISQLEFDDAMRDQMNKMRQRFGAQFDESMFNTAEAKQSVLDNLIDQKALKAEIDNAHLVVTDGAVAKYLLGIPGFTKPDGSFDTQNYKNMLASQGLNAAIYEASLRQQMLQQQIVGAIEQSAFTPKTVVAQIDNLMSQEREIQALTFKASDFASQVKLTEPMLKTFYDAHNEQFTVPENAKIEYVVLSEDAVAAQMTVTPEDIKSVYEQNLKNYTTEEERRASHILIKCDKSANPKDKATAKARAEELLALVRKQPNDFTELAKKYSQDEGSASQGGDLNFFGKGMMLKPFEDAVYKLKRGDISDIVESDFGFHIIKLTDIKPASIKSLEQVKNQIAEDVKKQKGSKKFNEMAENFTNIVYEQSDSLKPAAEKLKLTIKFAENLTRTSIAEQVNNPILANPKFLKALFSDDVIKNKRNTETIEVGANTLISGRIVEYKAANKIPFEQVKETVIAKVTELEEENLAKKAGEKTLTNLINSNGMGSEKFQFDAIKLISRLQPNDVSQIAFDELMKADTRKLPTFIGVVTPNQGYVIYRINKVKQGGVDTNRVAEIGRQVDGSLASAEFFAYIQLLRQKGNVKIVKPFDNNALLIK